MRLPSLHQFFRHQLEQGFHAHGRSGGDDTVEYVSELLARFAQTRMFHALHDAEGRPLEHIIDMLQAQQEAQEARSAGREGSIARYIGDYTLFMTGLFRERVAARGELDYYTAHGRSAFWQSADYTLNPNQRRVYRQLCQDFAPISDILDYLRRVQWPRGETSGSQNVLAAFWRS